MTLYKYKMRHRSHYYIPTYLEVGRYVSMYYGVVRTVYEQRKHTCIGIDQVSAAFDLYISRSPLGILEDR